MYSNYMRTHRFNKNVFVVNRHAVRVRSQMSRQYMTDKALYNITFQFT